MPLQAANSLLFDKTIDLVSALGLDSRSRFGQATVMTEPER
jgi:hypothetical protein